MTGILCMEDAFDIEGFFAEKADAAQAAESEEKHDENDRNKTFHYHGGMYCALCRAADGGPFYPEWGENA